MRAPLIKKKALGCVSLPLRPEATKTLLTEYCRWLAGTSIYQLLLAMLEHIHSVVPTRLVLTISRMDSNIILNWRCFVPFISVSVCKHSNKLKFDMGKCRREEGTLLFLCRTSLDALAKAFSIRYGSAPKGIFGDSNQFSDS